MEELKLKEVKVFSNDLLAKINELKDLEKADKKLRKAEITETAEKLKAEYKSLAAELEPEIQDKLTVAKSEHEKALKLIEEEKQKSLQEIEAKHSKLTPEELQDKKVVKEYEDSKKGALIVAKRATIQENAAFDNKEKDAKLLRVDLHNDYLTLLKSIAPYKGTVENFFLGRKLELQATFSLKKKLKDKAFWASLIPFFMLCIIIGVYFIIGTVKHHNMEFGDIINNGIFISVVATGAVYIYSGGNFDMSLGPASLMCATVAGIVFSATKNVALTLVCSLALGIVLGIVNAILANVLDLPVMVMTLTMMNILNAVQAVILEHNNSSVIPGVGLPNSPVVFATYLVTFFILLWVIFNYTKVGRRNKFIGSNAVAARFNGISLMKSGIISFAISGIGLGLAGFLFTSSMSTPGTEFSTGTVLDTIGLNVVIAIVFGGMTTSGGPRSRVSCAIIGAFFGVFLDQVFVIAGVENWKYIAKGLVFLAVSFANMYSSRPKMLAR